MTRELTPKQRRFVVPAGKRTYHHGNLREALIEAAGNILCTQGLGGFSLRAVARAAGVSHSAPYRHFDSYDDLLDEALRRNGLTMQPACLVKGCLK